MGYDDDSDDKYSPEEIKNREEDLGEDYNNGGIRGALRYHRDRRGDKQKGLREASQSRKGGGSLSPEDIESKEGDVSKDSDKSEEDEYKKLGNFLKENGDSEDDEDATGGSGWKNKVTGKKGNNFKKLGLTGVLASVVLGGFGFLSFISNFQMDSIIENVDAATFTRFNASFDRRSDRWVRAYIRLRLTEFGGDTKGDNLYFRSSKVDTNNPIRDWYATLRTSDFEKRVFEDNGIRFTSMVDSEGNFRTAKLTIRNDNVIPPDKFNKYQHLFDGDIDITNIDSIINGIEADDLDLFIQQEIFESDKAGRKAVKKLVDDHSRKWQVLKRRHHRKDIQNMTGIRDWRLFEKTRDKVDKRKIDIQKKIINKTFSGNGNTSKFMRCLLGGAACPKTKDMSHKDNRASVPNASGDEADLNEQEDQIGENDSEDPPNGNDADLKPVEGEDLANSVEEAGEAAFGETTEELAEDAASAAVDDTILLSARQQFVKEITERIVGSGGPASPMFYWGIATKLTAIHGLFQVSGDGTSSVEKMVYGARASQAAASYGTAAIANDQIKSGELVGDELSSWFDVFKNFQNSESWVGHSSGNSFGTVSAAAASNPTKETYCSDSHVPLPDEFAFYCDKLKPNGGGNAAALTATYNATVGVFVAPIAAMVTAVRSNPVTRNLESFTSAVFGAFSDNVAAPLMKGLTDAFGVTDNINGAIASVTTSVLSFMGVGPTWAGEPGFINLVFAGGAVAAESGARMAGAMAQTPTTAGYSSRLAAQFEAENTANMSLYERYASLSNSQSLAAQAMVNHTTLTKSLHTGNVIGGMFSNMGNIFTGVALAQDTDYSATATWAGVDKYDIPQECVDGIDPLDMTVLSGTNYDEKTGRPGDLDWETVRDHDKFMDKLYDWASENENEEADRMQIASSVYNCHLFENRVAGGLGNTSGYTDDGGYEESASGEATEKAANPKIYFLGDSLTDGMKNNGGLDQKLSEKGWEPTSNGLGSRQIENGPAPDGLTQITNDEESVKSAGTIVIALGTNFAGSDLKVDLQKMYDKVKQLNPTANLWWVNYVGTGTYADTMSTRSIALAEWAADKNVKIIDWASVGVSTGQIGNNEVHPSNYDGMAQYIVDQLGQPPAVSGGLGISPDGFVFPVKTTKTVIGAGTSQNGTTLKWCTTSLTNCHHDYNAADIFVPEGTPVVAAKDGTVIFAHDKGPGEGSSVAILVDGFVFWYGHLQSGSITSRNIIAGMVIKAGDELGAVGNNSDADGTAGHLHFDAQPSPPATTRQNCASEACTLPPFVFTDVQPVLVPSYNALPE